MILIFFLNYTFDKFLNILNDIISNNFSNSKIPVFLAVLKNIKKQTFKQYFINEVFLFSNVKAICVDVRINDKQAFDLQKVSGYLLASPLGCFGLSHSFQNSIFWNETHNSLQITPIAPILSKKAQGIINSIIINNGFNKIEMHLGQKLRTKIQNGEHSLITVTIDGHSQFKDILNISITNPNIFINILKPKDKNFWYEKVKKFC